eukprot:340863-Pyramimonas_sp.AAC.1
MSHAILGGQSGFSTPSMDLGVFRVVLDELVVPEEVVGEALREGLVFASVGVLGTSESLESSRFKL